MKNIIYFLIFFNLNFVFSQTNGAREVIKQLYNGGNEIDYFSGDNQGGFILGFMDGAALQLNTQTIISVDISKIPLNQRKIKSVSFTPKGDGWIIIYDKASFVWRNIPDDLVNSLKGIYDKGNEIDFVQFSNEGGWIIVCNNGYSYKYKNFPSKPAKAIDEIYEKGHNIKSVAFNPSGGWIVIYGKSGFRSSNISEQCISAIRELNKEIYSISITEFSEYVILHEDGVSYNLTDKFHSTNALSGSNWSFIDVNNMVSTSGRKFHPQKNIKGDNILSITKVYVRDDGEHEKRGPAALGMSVYGSNDAQNWERFSGMELIGPLIVMNKPPNFEWDDWTGIHYSNYGLLDWDAFPNYKYIGFRITEGDHGSGILGVLPRWLTGSAFKDDTVLSVYGKVDDLKTGQEIQLDGRKDDDATLWLKTVRKNGS